MNNKAKKAQKGQEGGGAMMLSLVSLLISIFALLFSIIHAVYKDDSDDDKLRQKGNE